MSDQNGIESRDECPECGSRFLGRIAGSDVAGICPDCGWRGNLYRVISDG